MPWSRTLHNQRSVYTETVQLAGVASTANGSTIYFLSPGEGFTALINTGAIATVGAVTTDLEGSYDGTNWVDVDNLFGIDLNSATVVKNYSSASSGDFPYYRLTFDSVLNETANTITVRIISNLRDA